MGLRPGLRALAQRLEELTGVFRSMHSSVVPGGDSSAKSPDLACRYGGGWNGDSAAPPRSRSSSRACDDSPELIGGFSCQIRSWSASAIVGPTMGNAAA